MVVGRRGAGTRAVLGLVLVLAAVAACGSPATVTGTGSASAAAPSAGTGSGAATGTAAATGTVTADLTGFVVHLDAGHDGGNGSHPDEISRLVQVGNGTKACDTAGAETDSGYPEHAFTYDVVDRAAALLRARGATVVLSRSTDTGVGPCVTERAAIGNRAGADAAVSVHADGADATSRGFHVILPAAVAGNDAIVAPSRALGTDLRDAFLAGTGEPESDYTGTTTGALVTRSDLGGLNLSTVPKVFIECANMRNAEDAALVTSPAWRQRAAAAIAGGIGDYLTAG